MMRRSYLKIEYLDDTQRPMLSILSLNFSTENAWNVLFQVPYKDVLYHLFIKVYYYL